VLRIPVARDAQPTSPKELAIKTKHPSFSFLRVAVTTVVTSGSFEMPKDLLIHSLRPCKSGKDVRRLPSFPSRCSRDLRTRVG
jgi:hypothetical protein